MDRMKDENIEDYIVRSMAHSFTLGQLCGVTIGVFLGTPLGALAVYLLMR